MGNKIYDFSILRELRKRENLNIAEFSEKSGVSASVISKLERNQSVAELETIFRLARVLGLTASDLIALAEDRTAHLASSKKYKNAETRIKKPAESLDYFRSRNQSLCLCFSS